MAPSLVPDDEEDVEEDTCDSTNPDLGSLSRLLSNLTWKFDEIEKDAPLHPPPRFYTELPALIAGTTF